VAGGRGYPAMAGHRHFRLAHPERARASRGPRSTALPAVRPSTLPIQNERVLRAGRAPRHSPPSGRPPCLSRTSGCFARAALHGTPRGPAPGLPIRNEGMHRPCDPVSLPGARPSSPALPTAWMRLWCCYGYGDTKATSTQFARSGPRAA